MPFKYEKLHAFCFGCGFIGHEIRECNSTPSKIKNLPKDDLPYFLALKAELNFIGILSTKLGYFIKKSMYQNVYLGLMEEPEDPSTFSP